MSFLTKKSVFSLILMVFTAFLSNCDYPEIKKQAPNINELATKSKFSVHLPENHSTGYIWQLSDDYDKNLVKSLNVVWHGNEKGAYFNLSALASGQTTLTFVSRKYTDTSAVKQYIVKIGDY